MTLTRSRHYSKDGTQISRYTAEELDAAAFKLIRHMGLDGCPGVSVLHFALMDGRDGTTGARWTLARATEEQGTFVLYLVSGDNAQDLELVRVPCSAETTDFACDATLISGVYRLEWQHADGFRRRVLAEEYFESN